MGEEKKPPGLLKRWTKRALIALGGLFLLIQLVPYGRNHANPPKTQEPDWSSPRVRDLAVRACFDCHSNETRWPWYSHVAPMSWLVQRDVEEGRKELNFSEFHRIQKHAKDAASEVEEGEMPLKSYLFTHSEARLTPAEKEELIRGLRDTFGD